MTITIIGRNLETELAFKNCAPFITYITKIDEITIFDAENDKTDSLWFYSENDPMILAPISLPKTILNFSNINLNYCKTLKQMEWMETS